MNTTKFPKLRLFLAGTFVYMVVPVLSGAVFSEDIRCCLSEKRMMRQHGKSVCG